MSTKQKFGGPWTVEKLSILSAYLDFYVTALKNQPFKKIYIDAFAGTGKIKIGNGGLPVFALGVVSCKLGHAPQFIPHAEGLQNSCRGGACDIPAGMGSTMGHHPR